MAKLFECKTYGRRKPKQGEESEEKDFHVVFVACDRVGLAAEAAQDHFEEEGIEGDSLEIAQVKVPFIERAY